VRAVDALTLEMRLNAPVAYFIYIAAMPPLYPLPRAVVERYGDEWWRPEHIVSNGAFQLAEFDDQHGLLRRNPTYFGSFPGNLDQVEWRMASSEQECVRAYVAGQADYVAFNSGGVIPDEVPSSETLRGRGLFTLGLSLIPRRPPMSDVRFRRAIAHATDRERLARAGVWSYSWTHGGIVPPGLAGHSPELGLKFDLERARQLLAEAGYAPGAELPVLKFYHPSGSPGHGAEEFKRQMRDHLGLRLQLVAIPTGVAWWSITDSDIQVGGWIGDYPDPDNFLRQSFFYRVAWERGWRHARLKQLLEEAAQTPDRARRLAMYREADRIMVNEEAVAVPLSYAPLADADLVKPWVKGLKYSALAQVDLREIEIEPR